MSKLHKDLSDFEKWCKENTTRNLFEGISLAISNYKKSLISEASSESRSLSDNEDQEKDCTAYSGTGEIVVPRFDGSCYTVPCDCGQSV